MKTSKKKQANRILEHFKIAIEENADSVNLAGLMHDSKEEKLEEAIAEYFRIDN